MTDNFATNGSSDEFIVAGRSASDTSQLTAFEDALKGISGASVVSRGGRPDQPHLVVNLPLQDAEQLKSRFGTALIIERNAKLSPF
ncbi:MULTISPECIES: hypothetical protein [Bradyrhizobium]|uniref:Uncharacterized protein n=1 Tax=Bradyrhizobium aeschynomenes TaxID=2734909 RepID=A0ABX2CEI4_9BRAD|nr:MULTISPECIES: hypothetical protein [Bradyrhizobium]NPU14317.1 hypothetical protein [Bradyrhizobium aeschynomenes]NPU66634.1 hypothetical protein [Bradyrhizobium aeschynomenes]NPV20344.1 hypothetical protein [Bradyrhizobium aeschynomenes]